VSTTPVSGSASFVAEHRVDHEQRFSGVQRAVQRGDFLHHRFVDTETAGRVDQQHVVIVALGPVHCSTRDIHRFLVRLGREEVGADLLGHRLQLRDSSGAVDVARNGKHLFLVLFAQELGELADCGGLARALQTGHQDDGGRRNREIQFDRFAFVVAADDRGQLALHHADQRLTRRQAADDFLAERLLFHLGDEFAHDGQRYVGLEEREAHFAQHFLGVRLGEAGFAAQRLDDARHPLSQIVEHGER
jgi:hypothetical protein